MLHSPITTSCPLLPLAGCKSSAVGITAKTASHPSSELNTEQQGSRQATSAAINIPSPPLTPYLGYDDDANVDVDVDELEPHYHDDLKGISSSRYCRPEDSSTQRHTRYVRNSQPQQEHEISIPRHSSSAPSMASPLQLRSSSSNPSLGFTFSGNISTNQPKEDRESYDFFLSKVNQDYWKSVSTIRSTYFFDGIGRGGGFLAIPHLASHGSAKTNGICRLLESWLTKKLVEPTISDSIPVLEDSIQSSVQSIESHLRADPKVWTGISQAFIHIRCGHVFMLDACCDDETIVHLGADEFYQDYPLFVDVEIKMLGDSTQLLGTQPTEVLIAFQNVASQDKGIAAERPYVHRAYISEEPPTTSSAVSSCFGAMRRQSFDGRNDTRLLA